MSLDFYAVFDINEYQNIQNTFSKNLGVSSITILPSGKPITIPSNFCSLCEEHIRKTKKGKAACYRCNAEIGKPNPSGPIIKQCMGNKGLWNAGVSIIVNGVHLASWVIGQVKNEQVDENYLLHFAERIGVNKDDFKMALDKVPLMSKEHFAQVANILYLFVNQLADKACKNLTLKYQLEEIKKTNELLIQSEKRNKLLFDKSNDAIFVITLPEGQYIDANESASRLTGRTREEIIKLKTKDLTPKGASKRLQQLVDGNYTNIPQQVSYLNPDGTIRQAKLSILPIDQHSSFGIAQDISGQIKASEALKHSHDLMQYIIEHSGSAIAVHDKELKYIYVSQNYLEEYGIQNNQVIGRHHYDVFPDLPQKWRDVHQKALKGFVSRAEEDPYEKEDGTVEWTKWECRPWYDQNKEIGGMIVFTEVITQRKKMEISLRESEGKYKFLFYNNPQPSWIYDLESLFILEVNDAAVLHYGYSREEFLGLTLRDIRPKEDIHKLIDNLKNIVNSEYNNSGQWRHFKKNGEVMDVAISSHLIEYRGKQARHVLINDITNRLKAENELKTALKQTSESDRLKSSFLANMSHEVRTPLNSIIGFSELLGDPDFDAEEKKEFIGHIVSNGNQLLTIISDIMDISKMESGEITIHKTQVNVQNFMSDLRDQFSFQAAAKNLEFLLVLPEKGEETLLVTDADRLTQVLSNLINNAIKFTAKGQIAIGFQPYHNLVEFYVRDTGIGISEEYQDKVFERFRQVEDAKTRTYGGNGLGLAISKNLVELMGGKIWVRSEPGKGSAFYFTIAAGRG